MDAQKTTILPGGLTTACLPPTENTHRALLTPARRGKGSRLNVPDEAREQTPAEHRVAMSWAQRLKHVFNVGIETCSECGGAVKSIICIEAPVVINRIIAHLKDKAAPENVGLLPLCETRAFPDLLYPVQIIIVGRLNRLQQQTY